MTDEIAKLWRTLEIVNYELQCIHAAALHEDDANKAIDAIHLAAARAIYAIAKARKPASPAPQNGETPNA